MKGLALLFVVTLVVACTFVKADLPVPSLVPLLIWSPQNYFQGSQQHLETVSAGDVQNLLQSTIGINKPTESSVDSLLSNIRENKPEVVVFFIESELGLEQFRKLGSAYAKDGSDCPLKNLKNSVSSSGSSIVFPYTLSGLSFSLSETINSIAGQLKTQQPTSSCILVRADGSSAFSTLTSSPNFIVKTPEDFLESLQNNPIAHNGVTDFVVVSFNQNFVQDDANLGAIERAVSTSTDGKYVALFSALNPRHSRVTRSSQSSQSFLASYGDGKFNPNCGTNPSTLDPLDWNDCDYYDNYFPVVVAQSLLVALLLLVILGVGLYCTASIQTPLRYEVPKQKRNVEQAY